MLVAGVLLLPGLQVAATEAIRPDAEIIGVASVIDGDTLEIHDRRIRLEGIDAPESAQLCLRMAGRSGAGRGRRSSWPI
jgi:endonuclease YncB( thermonuclease family)